MPKLALATQLFICEKIQECSLFYCIDSAILRRYGIWGSLPTFCFMASHAKRFNSLSVFTHVRYQVLRKWPLKLSYLIHKRKLNKMEIQNLTHKSLPQMKEEYENPLSRASKDHYNNKFSLCPLNPTSTQMHRLWTVLQLNFFLWKITKISICVYLHSTSTSKI